MPQKTFMLTKQLQINWHGSHVRIIKNVRTTNYCDHANIDHGFHKTNIYALPLFQILV